MAADGAGRVNQKRRTRKELLQAAARLMKSGARPTLEDVAAEALVSRATAYRYFPSVEALMVEAALDIEFPDANELFGDEMSGEPVARLEMADTAVNAMISANEHGLRLMLMNALERALKTGDDNDLPARQNRRTPLIDAALAPALDALNPADIKPLSQALALVFGMEARIVLKDVLQLSDAQADETRRWAIRALVDAARK